MKKHKRVNKKAWARAGFGPGGSHEPTQADLDAMKAATAQEKMLANVNHPQHYGGEANPYETIKVQEANLTPDELIGALKFQVHKYLDRHRRKNGLEDIKKAQWYLNRLVDYIESRDLGRSVGP